MNQKQNSLIITQEHSKNEWRYMLVLLVLGSILGVLIHNSAHKAILTSDQHAAKEARDVTPSQQALNSQPAQLTTTVGQTQGAASEATTK